MEFIAITIAVIAAAVVLYFVFRTRKGDVPTPQAPSWDSGTNVEPAAAEPTHTWESSPPVEPVSVEPLPSWESGTTGVQVNKKV